MRRYAKENNRDLPGWKRRRTEKLTAFMLMSKFQYLLIIKIVHHHQLAKPLSKTQLEYLRIMGLKSYLFTVPKG